MSETTQESSSNENAEADAISEEDRKFFEDYLKETEQRLAAKEEIRAGNVNVIRPPDSYFSKLDSSLKRNTTFVKKLKTFSGTQLDMFMKDMVSLNLTKYVSEVATALVDAKLKMTDVAPAIKACSVLHQTYAEFSTHFFENWQKILSFKVGDKIANPSKLRIDLRFYAELINAGIFTHKQGLPLLGSVLTVLINMDKEEHNNASIILSFCRHCGEDYAGLVPKRIRQLSAKLNVALPKSKLLTPDKQQNVKSLLRDYYNSLCKHLLKEHKELQAFEKQNGKILQTRGELSSERREKLEALQLSYERLLASVQNFSDTLDEPMPELPVADNKAKTEAEESLKMMMSEGEENSIMEDMWGDEETRRFYQVLTDLSVFLPGSYPKEPPPPPKQEEVAITEEVLDKDLTFEELELEVVEKPAEEVEAEVEEPQVSCNISNKILLDAFLSHLPNCVNREMIDNAAVDFLMNLNTKHNKRKLIKALFGVSRIRLDLLPFYSRLAAILQPVMPEVGNELCLMLKHDFKYHVHKKDQINIESKIKVVRYIGELVKFKLYSKIEALYCLKVLLHDFTHHHIEMACNLLETCGRFLFCSADSHQRTKVYLEQMMRKKAVTALDSRYVTIIENAYYFVNPPESTGTGRAARKDRPPVHEFIRKLLYQELSKTNTDKVLKWMRKLDWEDEGVASYAIKCLTAAHQAKYLNIRCVGSLLAGLVAHHEAVGPLVVDGVLEDIRLCMEINLPKYNQRRIAMVKYLGELYNYRMVESADIFRTLYLLITFGVSTEHAAPSPLDPPEHLFRIRLVCTLLETCGQYFSGGSSKKRLDYFLVFFQHYYCFKRADPVWSMQPDNPFPVGIDYMFRDTLAMLRPKMRLFESLKEAQAAVEELRATLYPDLQEEEPLESGGDQQQLQQQQQQQMSSIPELAEDGCEEQLHFEEEDPSESQQSEAQSEAQSEEEDCWTNERLQGTQDNDNNNTQGEQSLSGGGGAGGVLMDTSELVAALPAAPKRLHCPEDDDFLSALDKMVSDNIQDRMRDAVKPQQVDISVPLHVKSSSSSSTKKTYEQLQEGPSADSSTMDFVLMLRKGNKQQYKNLAVPVSSELAMNLRNREQEQKEEKERVKRLTLNITERQEEEDYQEAINQGTRPVTCVNLNRERRQKYNHPKGAPDADLIFGPKKIR